MSKNAKRDAYNAKYKTEKYLRPITLIRKDGIIGKTLPKCLSDTGETASSWILEAIKRRMIEEGYVAESDFEREV